MAQARTTDPRTTDRSPAELRAALAGAHLPTLLMAMATLSGDRAGWLRPEWRPAAPRGAGEDDTGGLPAETQREIRAAAEELVTRRWAGGLPPAPPPTPDQLAEMLEISLGPGNSLPAGIGPLLAEELGVASRDVEFPDVPADLRVLVVGAGFAGLCAGIKLRKAGVAFTIVDKNPDVGGTWLENTYPGCGVDTPSHLYSFSFAQRADWSRYFARRDELHRYLNDLADEYRLRPHIRGGLEVESMAWRAGERRWSVRLRAGDGRRETLTAHIVITATGYLNRPKYPDIAGLDSFAGPCMHTARWDPAVDVRGRRVAVIGTGASAMQLVPAIAGVAERVTVFQRSPQWGLPNPNQPRAVDEATRYLMREVPHYLGWYRLRLVWNFGDRLFPALQVDPEWPHPGRSVNAVNDRHRAFLAKYIARELGDRADELLPVCLPDYPPYGKRPLLDAGWFRTVRRDDVEVVTDPVAKVTPGGVVTEPGREIPADVLVLATGFQNLNLLAPIEVRGRSGRTLRETWGEDDARAYLGMTVPDFPNFFMLLGPNTIAGHGGSAALGIEMELGYVMKLLARMLAEGIDVVECRPEVHDRYTRRLDAALERTIWAHPGMTTYYRNGAGRVVTTMPWTNVEFRELTQEPDLADFHAELGLELPGGRRTGRPPQAGFAGGAAG
ncbi:NAD(P)/FAD-dependent oxidoreductase [Pseudonocardia eucalypti]|uniref:NAD(P)/FAD-dependent oxidoreductase n=1 Tax=Pseudonocardia eucalypti TaxID=648755 RepID=A0ABP9RDE3_9PSEU|nr:4-hydroxyacetophenone monooxygenase [Pseudonocardia eucalypti]